MRGAVFMLTASVAGPAMAQQKIAQNLVQYQATPKGGLQCDQCLQWVPPDGCKVVEGKIAAKGWCAAFVAKPK